MSHDNIHGRQTSTHATSHVRRHNNNVRRQQPNATPTIAAGKSILYNVYKALWVKSVGLCYRCADNFRNKVGKVFGSMRGDL